MGVNTLCSLADDLALMAGGPKEMQDLLSLIGEAALGLGLKFKASMEVFYLPHHKGGMNLFPLATHCDISTVAQAEKFLRSTDPGVRHLAWGSLQSVVNKRAKSCDTGKVIAYLNGSTDGGLGYSSNDHSTFWSRTRSASIRAQCSCKATWSIDDIGPVIRVQGAIPPTSPERAMKCAFRDRLIKRLVGKPSQGKVYASTCQSIHANHFLQDGTFLRFTDWNFIFRARLNVLPVNNAHDAGTLMCRRCGKWEETLPHVLNHCEPSMLLVTARHDRILHRLSQAMPVELQALLKVDCTPLHSSSQLRSDLIVTDEARKTVTMVDVTVPFDNGPRAMEEARQQKRFKYCDIERELTAKGYKVINEAFVVGSHGSFPARNFMVARELGIHRKYAELMAKLMVSETIRWSRDIYYTHVLGEPQERPRALEQSNPHVTPEAVKEAAEAEEEVKEEVCIYMLYNTWFSMFFVSFVCSDLVLCFSRLVVSFLLICKPIPVESIASRPFG